VSSFEVFVGSTNSGAGERVDSGPFADQGLGREGGLEVSSSGRGRS
jgi:hypothetical protein